MIAPEERSRDLIWGGDMLEELSRDVGLLAYWRDEAAELLGLYPSMDFLNRCDARHLSQLHAFAGALTKARSLLEHVRTSETCSAQRWQHLQVLHRHFYQQEPA